ncbi:MAG: hypothetical protein AAFQ64_16175 [Pseudomonadota bacterium]
MAIVKGSLRWGANFVGLSAALHLIAPFLGGFGGISPALAGLGIVYLVMAYGLYQNVRWVGYVAFLAMFIGLSAAISNIWTPGPVPGWLFMAISAANVAAVIALFIALWQSRPEPAP